MATTNFASMTDEQVTIWSRQFWHETINKTYMSAFIGDGPNAMIQRIKEFSMRNGGARAVITLINETLSDGVVGDNQLLNNESQMTSDEQVINIDQWRDAHRTTGEMNDMRTLINFREAAKFSLSNIASRVMDELWFMTLSGISYAFRPNGAARIGSELPLLEFADDVTPPSANRHFRWDATTGISPADTSQIIAADTPSWEMLVDLKALAVERFIPPIRTDNGILGYNVFMSPRGMAKLKKDPDFLAAWREAEKRGGDNPLFKGTALGGRQGVYIDGLNILEYRNVFNTLGTATKWGAGNLVDGQRVLLCGAQAGAFADIQRATWREEKIDYQNQHGISIGKKFGMLKPKFFSTHTQTVEDFSVIALDTAI